jgi:hypothetical protein
MTAKQIAEQLRLPRSTVARIVSRAGLGRLKYLEPSLPAVRYEWQRPGDLIHLDVKKLGRIKGIGHRITGHHAGMHRSAGIGWEFVHVCIDDHSRLAYVEVLEDEKGPTTVGFLRRALAWFADHGVTVRRVMTDNGTNYRSLVFRAAIAQLRLKHIRTRPYTPRTMGRRSGSSRRCCGSGPTSARTPARPAGGSRWPPGYAGTMSGAPTEASGERRPSLGWRRLLREQPPWNAQLARGPALLAEQAK